MYPDVEGQSSPERPAPRSERRFRESFLRALFWILGIATFVALAAYAIGGRSIFRRLLQFRTRAFTRLEESLQPPTPAEMAAAAARATRDTASVMASDKPPSASAALIIVCTVALMTLVVIAFYVTGRRGRRRPGR